MLKLNQLFSERNRGLAGIALLSMALAKSPVGATPQVSEEEAISRVKQLRTSELDASLPHDPFADWLAQAAGPDASIAWEMNDCGEQSGDPSTESARDTPVCVGVDIQLLDERIVSVLVLVGTWEKGLTGKPRVRDLYWTEGHLVHPLKRLGEIPEIIQSKPPEEQEPAQGEPSP